MDQQSLRIKSTLCLLDLAQINYGPHCKLISPNEQQVRNGKNKKIIITVYEELVCHQSPLLMKRINVLWPSFLILL
jgi:hypothetical protein